MQMLYCCGRAAASPSPRLASHPIAWHGIIDHFLASSHDRCAASAGILSGSFIAYRVRSSVDGLQMALCVGRWSPALLIRGIRIIPRGRSAVLSASRLDSVNILGTSAEGFAVLLLSNLLIFLFRPDHRPSSDTLVPCSNVKLPSMQLLQGSPE